MTLKAVEIKFLQKPRLIVINYNNNVTQQLSCDELYALLAGKAAVTKNIIINDIDIVNDTVNFKFSDGHHSDYYRWLVLHDMISNYNSINRR